jgi:hypothetical protein
MPERSAAEWAEAVRAQLADLATIAGLLGEDAARYRGAAVEEAALAAFERGAGCALPRDLRALLRAVGVGAGPDYGLRAPAAMDRDDLPAVTANVPRGARVDRPFLLDAAFAAEDDDGDPRAPPLPSDAHLLDGCIEIAEIGCGDAWLLVVNGARTGEVWRDATAGAGELAPEAPFRDWIGAWLDLTLARAAERLARRRDAPGDRAAALDVLGRVRPLLTAAAAQRAELRACAAHVCIALGDRDAARDPLRVLEAEGDDAAAELRAAFYASDIDAARRRAQDVALATHPARAVRLALVENPDTSAALLRVLAADPDLEVRAGVVQHPRADAAQVAGMVEAAIAAMAAGRLTLVDAAIAELGLRGPAATAELIERVVDAGLASTDRTAAGVLRGAALATAGSDATRMRLVESPWPEVRHAVAAATRTPDALAALARDPDRLVRRAVATRRDASPQVLDALATDGERGVRLACARNPTTPARALVRLALDPYARSGLGRNPRTPPALLAALDLLMHGDRETRKVDPLDEPTPRAHVDELDLYDEVTTLPAYSALRKGLVGNHAFPVVALDAQLAGGGGMTAFTMAHRAWLPGSTLQRVARDAYAYARAGVASRPETPAALVEELARDPSEIVRRAAAESRALASETLRELCRDRDQGVRAAAASNGRLPVDELAGLATDSSPDLRCSVASNPQVPPALLVQLARDPSSRVRWVVAFAAVASAAILDALAEDAEPHVRARVAFRRAVAALAAP